MFTAALARSFPLTTRYVTKMLPFDYMSFFSCNDNVIKNEDEPKQILIVSNHAPPLSTTNSWSPIS